MDDRDIVVKDTIIERGIIEVGNGKVNIKWRDIFALLTLLPTEYSF